MNMCLVSNGWGKHQLAKLLCRKRKVLQVTSYVLPGRCCHLYPPEASEVKVESYYQSWKNWMPYPQYHLSTTDKKRRVI